MARSTLIMTSLAVVQTKANNVGNSVVTLSNSELLLADFLTQVNASELSHGRVHLRQGAGRHWGHTGFLVGVGLLVNLEDFANQNAARISRVRTYTQRKSKRGIFQQELIRESDPYDEGVESN